MENKLKSTEISPLLGGRIGGRASGGTSEASQLVVNCTQHSSSTGKGRKSWFPWMLEADMACPSFRLYLLILLAVVPFGSHFVKNSMSSLEIFFLKDETFHINNLQYGSLISAVSLPSLILPFLGGVFLDNKGHRIFILVFLCICVVGQVGFVLSVTWGLYVIAFVCRVIFGVGSSNVMVVQRWLVSHIFRDAEMSGAFGFLISFANVANFMAKSTVAVVAVRFGDYHYALWYSVLFCLLSVGAGALLYQAMGKLGDIGALVSYAEDPSTARVLTTAPCSSCEAAFMPDGDGHCGDVDEEQQEQQQQEQDPAGSAQGQVTASSLTGGGCGVDGQRGARRLSSASSQASSLANHRRASGSGLLASGGCVRCVSGGCASLAKTGRGRQRSRSGSSQGGSTNAGSVVGGTVADIEDLSASFRPDAISITVASHPATAAATGAATGAAGAAASEYGATQQRWAEEEREEDGGIVPAKRSLVPRLGPMFWVVCFLHMGFINVYHLFYSFSSKFIADKWGTDAVTSGLVSSLTHAFVIVLAPSVGYVVDRVGHRLQLVFAAGVATLVAYYLLTYSSMSPIPPILLMSFSFAFLPTVLMAAVPLTISPEVYGIAFGVIEVVDALGAFVGNLTMGYIRDQSADYTACMLGLGLLAVLCLLLTLVLAAMDRARGGVLSRPCTQRRYVE